MKRLAFASHALTFGSLLVAGAQSVHANTFSVSGPGGGIPDPVSTPGTWNSTYTGTPFLSNVTVPDAVTGITSVQLSGFNHTWRGDLHILLKSPMADFNLVVRPGSNGITVGDSGDYLSGTYLFVESGGGSVAAGAANISGGTYNQFFNGGTGQWTNGITNTPLSSITGPAGTWTLEIRDWANLDSGSLTGWTLSGLTTSTGFGFPNENGVIPCPCGNNPVVGSMRGCNNSANTGGALLDTAGNASIAVDTLTFTASDVLPTSTSILFQGTAPIPAGVLFGDGVRCEGGTLTRLYLDNASGGVVSFPGFGDPPVSVQSGASAGLTLYYSLYYRDPDLTFCFSFAGGATYNKTPGRIIVWNP